ncbi:hypothetical protein MMC07_009996 [Pseudocyphellaria aurata]|nr:hypothetical protein [Pseudocyphellaria aurata]
MTTPAEMQALLRFVSQDAKVPLSSAMGKIKDLQKASLTSPDLIAQSNLSAIQSIFAEEKLAKQILSAAKRAAKKRCAPEAEADEEASSPARKRKKPAFDSLSSPAAEDISPAAMEASLALPSVVATDEELSRTVLHANRAPLVLAFAVTLLRHTMAEQPLSSRLSLAQAVVSVNSRSKAAHLGLVDKGTSAEEEGWGAGQPRVRVMGREIRVLKRWGYEWKGEDEQAEEVSSSLSAKAPANTNDPGPPLWGLDLEALRSSSVPTGTRTGPSAPALPIHTPQSARSYLLKSFARPPDPDPEPAPSSSPSKPKPKPKPKNKSTAAQTAAEKARNLGLLLLALDRLYTSWAGVLSADELDRRSWAWYVAVRPEVANGVAGWGGRGAVNLGEILRLTR